MRDMTGLDGVRFLPSSYRVTSPSKVTSSTELVRTRPNNWAELRVRRMSLKDGATKRLRLMQRRSSW